LLVAIAVHQVAATRYGDLTPWLGGGFGMFSTIDTPGNRAVSIRVFEPGIVREIYDLPASFSALTEGALAFPTQTRLNDLARRVAEHLRNRGRTFDAVEVTVWRDRPQPLPVRSARVDFPV
jgi:hypothetical protein